MEPPPPQQDVDPLAPTPACAALFPQFMPEEEEDGATTTTTTTSGRSGKGGKPQSKWGTAPPMPFPLLQAFERWLSGVPSPPELMALGSAPPPPEDECVFVGGAGLCVVWCVGWSVGPLY